MLYHFVDGGETVTAGCDYCRNLEIDGSADDPEFDEFCAEYRQRGWIEISSEVGECERCGTVHGGDMIEVAAITAVD